MKRYLFLISIILLSCQEEITLDLPQTEDKLVVEGAIEPGFPPYVILTKNQGYFESIDIDTYNDLFVNNIDSVKVWYYNANGEKEIRILEQIPGLDSLPPIYTDLSYFANSNNYVFSQAERTYYLEIHWNNEIISAETTIPQPTPLDCLWVEKSEIYQAEQLDKLGMEVIEVDLRDAYAFGGGLHCCTADVYREGELKDYFPKQ